MLDEMPDLHATVVILIKWRRGAGERRTGRTKLAKIQRLVFMRLVRLLRQDREVVYRRLFGD